MSQTTTFILGLIAGSTILLGLPVGRMRKLSANLRLSLNALAIGILLFLTWDVLTHAWEPIDITLGKLHDHTGGVAGVIGYGTLFFLGLGVGLLSLVYYERHLHRRNNNGSDARRLALMIAIGIGLHNFGEGLAIGNSAASGEIALATVLVIGFALHNGTEGFGIVAPLAAEQVVPSWRYLFGLGAIGGLPTLLGTVIGRQVVSEPLSVVFLTLAAGSIIYVIVQLLGIAARSVRRDLVCWGVFIGLFAGFVTDMVVTAGGA